MNSLQSVSSSHSFVPVPLSNGYYLPTNYKPLYGQRSDTDQLEVRLQTFLFWPSWVPATLDVGEMARSGLYYTGDGDEVTCFRCSFTFKNWKTGDDPKLKHQSVSPHCRSLLENEDSDELGEDFVDSWVPPSNSVVRQTSRTSNVANRTPSYDANVSSRRSNEDRCDGFSACDGVAVTHDSEDSDCGSESSDGAAPDRLLDADSSTFSGEDISRESSCNLETFEISRIFPNVCKSEDLSNNKRLLRVEGRQRRFNTHTKQRLKDENEKLRRAMTCRRCNEVYSQTLFLPCRHLVTCERCAEEMDECIACQAKILGTVRIFMT